MPEPSSRYVTYARLGRVHGLRGELRLQLFHAESEHLDAVDRVRLVGAAGELNTRLLRVRGSGDALIASLEGIDSREAAQVWVNAELQVPEELFNALDEEDTWYAWQLEGLKAVDAEGRPIGRVLAVENYGAGDILVVEGRGGTQLIPFAAPWVGEVDLEAGSVVVDPGWAEE